MLAPNLGVVPATAPSQHIVSKYFRGLARRLYLLERMACPFCAVSQSVTKPECPVKANVALRRSSSDDASKLATALRAPSSPAHTKPRWSGSTLILRGRVHGGAYTHFGGIVEASVGWRCETYEMFSCHNIIESASCGTVVPTRCRRVQSCGHQHTQHACLARQQ